MNSARSGKSPRESSLNSSQIQAVISVFIIIDEPTRKTCVQFSMLTLVMVRNTALSGALVKIQISPSHTIVNRFDLASSVASITQSQIE